MEDTEEILDLVNKNDEVIGQIKRSETAVLGDLKHGYIRAVNVFIVNSEGRVWVPTRTADKVVAPNGLDYSVGGHVSSGESYIESCLREAEEEVNLLVNPSQLEFVTKTQPSEANGPYFFELYVLRSDETPEFNPDDFVSAEWLTLEAFLTRLESGVPSKGSLKQSVKDLTQYLQKPLAE